MMSGGYDTHDVAPIDQRRLLTSAGAKCSGACTAPRRPTGRSPRRRNRATAAPRECWPGHGGGPPAVDGVSENSTPMPTMSMCPTTGCPSVRDEPSPLVQLGVVEQPLRVALVGDLDGHARGIQRREPVHGRARRELGSQRGGELGVVHLPFGRRPRTVCHRRVTAPPPRGRPSPRRIALRPATNLTRTRTAGTTR